MFRSVFQPVYRQLVVNSNNKTGLIVNQQLMNNLIGNQRRHFIKKIFKKENRTTLTIFVVSFASGIAFLTYSEYRDNNFKNSFITKIKGVNQDWDPIQRKVTNGITNDSLVGNYLAGSILDNLKITKTVNGNNKLPGKRLVLLQYTNCPFCCKVRTFLEYYDIPFDIVEVNPLTRKQIRFSKYRKVPILLIEDEKLRKENNLIIQLNDSSSIISVLGTYLFCNSKQKDSLESIINKYESLQYTMLDSKKKVKEITNKYFLLYGESLSEQEFKKIENDLLNERKWRKWVDDVFVHVLSPNIYRTTKEAIQAFNYFSEVSDWEKNFSALERLSVIYIGGLAMFILSKWLKKKYNLKDDVRQSLYDNCNYFIRSKGNDKEFIGGVTPNLSDISIFGVLSSIEGCDAFKDLTENTKVSSWYFKMKKLVEQHGGSNQLKNYLKN